MGGRYIKFSQCIHTFCYAAEGADNESIIRATAKILSLPRRDNEIQLVRDILDLIETTPAYEDKIAHSKLRLRLLVEEAAMELYPQYRSAMGLKLPKL